jgi:actin-like ATPase involved in cell morphogenesis
VAALGGGSAVVASVVYLGADGQVVVGDAAQARALTDPDRVVRGFTGRIGDEVPMVIGGQAYTAAQITAMVVVWVVDQVAAQQGGPAQGIVLTHPAGWGGYKREVLVAALAAAGLGQVQLWPEAVAAAAGYAARQRIAPGHCIAVYDLGGATFEAAVVDAPGGGELSVLGTPQGLDQLGGADFDDAVFGHVLAAVPALAELDADDPATLAATAALRRECTLAKQALSADTEVTIPVVAPGIHTHVRLHRTEFDDMIRPQLTETVQALRRTLDSAHIQPQQLDTVLLVGGSSRIPLVAQLVSTELDQPITIGADPDTAAALGAAALAAPTSQVDNVADAQPTPEPPTRHLTSFPEPTFPPSQQPERPSLTAIPLDVEPAGVQRRRTSSRRVKRAALASGLALLTAAAVASVPFLLARSDTNPPANAGTPPPSASSVPGTPMAGTPPVPDSAGTMPGAGTGGEVDSGASSSTGVVRTTSPAAPNRLGGAHAKPGPAGPPVSAPASSWVTTYTWTTSWSNPPPTTTRTIPTTPPAPTTTASATPPATTTQPPPRPTSTDPSPRRPTT